MPLNIIEAMLCKKPVVASHNRGHDELVTEETGVLIDPLDVEGLCSNIANLAENKKRMKIMGEAAFVRARYYSVGYVKQELWGVLLDAIKFKRWCFL